MGAGAARVGSSANDQVLLSVGVLRRNKPLPMVGQYPSQGGFSESEGNGHGLPEKMHFFRNPLIIILFWGATCPKGAIHN